MTVHAKDASENWMCWISPIGRKCGSLGRGLEDRGRRSNKGPIMVTVSVSGR